MSIQSSRKQRRWLALATLIAGGAVIPVHGQVPVDDAGQPYPGSYDAEPYDAAPSTTGASIETIGNGESIPILRARELDELVGPVALYPDTLLAIVLPAAVYPLQVVQAARFLEELESDPSLTPSPEWDEAVVALLNYPEVLALLNEDIDWTLRLGEAVIAQQADVIDAVQRFRDRAYLAGNLRSDERQNIVREDEVIEISPVNESTIYVPYYEPETVIRHTIQPVYTYYPDPYPVYYYPYPDGHAFRNGFFWGVTSAYALGWRQDRLHVIHHSFSAHPYYGRHYGWRWWYRRPSLVYHDSLYYRPSRAVVRNRFGDYWIPRRVRHAATSDYRSRTQRVARTYTTRQTPRRQRVETVSRHRPSISSVERSLREQGTRRSDRVMTPTVTASRRTSSHASLPSRSRSVATTRRSGAPAVTPRSSSPPVYRRNEPARPSGSANKRSQRPAPASASAPSRSSRSRGAQPHSSQRSATTRRESSRPRQRD